MLSQYKLTISILIKIYAVLCIYWTFPALFPDGTAVVILFVGLFTAFVGYFERHSVPVRTEYSRIQLHFRE